NQDIVEVKKLCKDVFVFDRRKQWSIQNIAKTGLSKKAFLITGHTLPPMKKKIAELLREESFDVVHCETSYVFQNVPKTKLPIVLVEHNIEYQVYARFADKAPVGLQQLLRI